MAQAAGRILKGSQVDIEGTYQIGSSVSDGKPASDANAAEKSPQARIIENNERCVVIQVVCSCGKQINLRGEYMTAHSHEN